MYLLGKKWAPLCFITTSSPNLLAAHRHAGRRNGRCLGNQGSDQFSAGRYRHRSASLAARHRFHELQAAERVPQPKARDAILKGIQANPTTTQGAMAAIEMETQLHSSVKGKIDDVANKMQ